MNPIFIPKNGWSILLQTVQGASRSLFLSSSIFLLTFPRAHAILDTNENAASDLWERHFNNGNLYSNFAPYGDPDGDGWTNEQEAVSGTDPADANPPTGFLRPEITQIPAVYLSPEEEGGPPTLITPAATSIEWLTLAGKQYTLFASADLSPGSWAQVGEPRIGSTSILGTNIPLTQPDGSVPESLFLRVSVTHTDSDDDGLTDSEEGELGTDASNQDTDGDGLTDKQESEDGTDPKDPDSDDDLLNDGEDAVPKDAEINWKKTPESKYVWIEQMVLPVDDYGGLIAPVAVNSSGQILFPWYTAGEDGSSTDPPKHHLWDSITRQWTDLPSSGSQAIEIEPGLTFTAADQAGGFIDINDAGTVSALARGGQSSPYTSTVGAHVISGTQSAMIWEKTGIPPTYGPPKYSIYHPTHPIISCPDCGSDFRNRCWSELDISAHAGASYLWRNWRAPGGRIGIDGSMNLCANISGSTYNFSPVWLLRDGATTSPLLDLEIKKLGGSQLEYLTQLGNGDAFAGAILDKNRALFVETLNDANASNLWLKDGEGVEIIATIAPTLRTDQTDIIRAPSKKTDQSDRLWIAAESKVLLEKLVGGSGANRWHEPASMGEGAIRLNPQGVAITRGKTAAGGAPIAPPKLWSNGKYTDLNDPKITSKPSTVTITEAIDFASNGIILVRATEGTVTKTGLLIPVEVTWKPIDGWDNVSPHNDPWTNKENGNRIFPCFKDPDDTELRAKLQVIVKTSPALVGKTVYVKAFDVDDSTSEAFDKNADQNSGIYEDPVIDTNGKAGYDNLADYLNTQLAGQFWNETTSSWGGQTSTGVVDANGETKFHFRVGMQPGNNYRVVASVNDEAMYDGVQTADPSADKYLGAEFYQNGDAPATPLLTVWRRLWVENDSMAAIGNYPDGNKKNDLTSDLATPTVSNATLNTAGTGTVFSISPISDASSFLQLENGRIIVHGIPHDPVTGTGEVLEEHFVSVSGDFTDIPVGAVFRLYDDDDFGLNAPPLPRNNIVDERIKSVYKAAFIDVIDAKQWNGDDHTTRQYLRCLNKWRLGV